MESILTQFQFLRAPNFEQEGRSLVDTAFPGWLHSLYCARGTDAHLSVEPSGGNGRPGFWAL